MEDSQELKKLKEEYLNLIYAMQSGVKSLMQYEQGDTAETSPKHLRTGINSALCESGALIHLLIDKGVFTKEEFAKYLNDKIRRDVQSYERKLKIITGMDVTLG